MAQEIFQIQIALKGFKPKIWRRVLIPSDFLLPDLHTVIQIAMGWTGSHMHQFVKDRNFYVPKTQGDVFEEQEQQMGYEKVKVTDVLSQEKDKIVYEYDFGDSWEHEVVLEKILPWDDKFKGPTCLTGKMSCPPEDCGGVWGYADMLEAIQDPEHEEHENYIEWLGEDFDPRYFDKSEINQALKQVKRWAKRK